MSVPFADSVSQLVAGFSFRRAISLMTIIMILLTASWFVDYYTQYSLLNRLDKVTTLLERLEVLDRREELSDDLKIVRKQIIHELTESQMTPPPFQAASNFGDWVERIWGKFIAGALPWLMLTIFTLPGVFSRERNAIIAFGTLFSLTLFFGVVVAAVPPTGYWPVDFFVIPWGLMLFVGGVPLAMMTVGAFNKVREASLRRALLNNLRQIAAAADQHFLENGVTSVRAADLVGLGKGKYISNLNSIEGEDYNSLVVKLGEPIAVRLPTGERVSLPN